MFWTLMFPIILATLFNMALSNIYSSENFTRIKIGIVENAEYDKDADLKKAIESVSGADETGSSENLFDVKYTSKEDADNLLNNSRIQGYIYMDNGIKLYVKESGIDQTIIKGFLDDYQQTSSTIYTIVSQKPAAIDGGLIESVANRKDYLREVPVGRSAPNSILNYFYALLAMSCLYGGFWGLREVTSIQANQSPEGERICVAPIHKLKLFLSSMCAAATVQLAEIFILLAYMILALRIGFGNQLGYAVVTCIVGTLTGVTFGTFLSSIIKKGEGPKIGALIGSTMIMSFLSGMMYGDIKYIISTKAPALGYLNPASLITDCFYSLYCYDTHYRFFIDLSILCGFILIFSCTTYFVLRRQKYASI